MDHATRNIYFNDEDDEERSSIVCGDESMSIGTILFSQSRSFRLPLGERIRNNQQFLPQDTTTTTTAPRRQNRSQNRRNQVVEFDDMESTFDGDQSSSIEFHLSRHRRRSNEKSGIGINPGDSRPGAYEAGGRAFGEAPVWAPRRASQMSRDSTTRASTIRTTSRDSRASASLQSEEVSVASSNDEESYFDILDTDLTFDDDNNTNITNNNRDYETVSRASDDSLPSYILSRNFGTAASVRSAGTSHGHSSSIEFFQDDTSTSRQAYFRRRNNNNNEAIYAKLRNSTKFLCLCGCALITLVILLGMIISIIVGRVSSSSSSTINPPSVPDMGGPLSDCKVADPTRFPNDQLNIHQQCFCFGNVSYISPSVNDYYQQLITNFSSILIFPNDKEHNSTESFHKECSPQNEALLHLASMQTNDTERFALVVLYLSLNGTRWTKQSKWLGETPICTWAGVECLPDGSLDGLNLQNNRLSGSLPTEIGLLSSYYAINLSGNKGLHGSIPTEIGKISKAGILNAEFCSLKGQIPSTIGLLSGLEAMGLNFNDLSGIIPTEIGNMQRLEYLGLGDNRIIGTIPSEVGRLGSLKGLFLSNNFLTGQVCTEIGKLQQLENLFLPNDRLHGNEVLQILPNLEKLRSLDVSGLSLNGTFPLNSISKLTLQLDKLRLSSNKFTGTIPTEIGLFKNLSTLECGNNHFEGSLPTELGQLTKIAVLSFSENDLVGSVPSELENLSKLRSLSMKGNKLSGDIDSLCDFLGDQKAVFSGSVDKSVLCSCCEAPSC